MRLSKTRAVALIVAIPSLTALSSAQAASECPSRGTLSDWGVNSTGYLSIASGGTSLFPVRMEGEVSSSSISQNSTWDLETA